MESVRESGRKTKLVSIITVNYNQTAVTEALLESIFATNDYPAIEVIVVDNGSTIDPVPAWKLKYPRVKFLRSPDNLGFAGGNNLGMFMARGDYFFFVNNDTVFTPKLVSSMASYMKGDTDIGMASPKILYYDTPEMIQYAGFTPVNFYTGRNSCIGQYEQDKGQYRRASGPTGYVHGAAMMVRREAMIIAGKMPEGYFLYYEEMDWCEAIRRAGYSIHVNTRATIYHKESVSVGRKTALKEYFMNRNRILFIRRNASRLTAFIFYCYFLAIVAPKNLVQYLRWREWSFSKVFLRAILWHANHRADSLDTGYAIP